MYVINIIIEQIPEDLPFILDLEQHPHTFGTAWIFFAHPISVSFRSSSILNFVDFKINLVNITTNVPKTICDLAFEGVS